MQKDIPTEMNQQEGGSRQEPKKDALKLRLDLNLEVDIQLKAKINGSVTLSLLD